MPEIEILRFPSKIKTDISPSEKNVYFTMTSQYQRTINQKYHLAPDNEQKVSFSNVLLP